MDGLTQNEMEDALRAIAAMASRGERAQARFAPGTAQHTLQRNRLQALAVAATLIRQELGEGDAAGLAPQALEKAHAPIASLAGKSGKARQKLAPGSWQHTMLTENLKALQVAALVLEKALRRAEAVAPDAQTDR